MECSVDANPQAVDVKWSGPQGFLSDGPVLVLKSVSRYVAKASSRLSWVHAVKCEPGRFRWSEIMTG